MAVCAKGSVLVFMRYLLGGGVQLLGGGGKYGSRLFSGLGADDHQLIFVWPNRRSLQKAMGAAGEISICHQREHAANCPSAV